MTKRRWRCEWRPQDALADVRRIKSLLKKPTKAVIASAVLPARFSGLQPAARDFQAATHIRDLAVRGSRRVGPGVCRRAAGTGCGRDMTSAALAPLDPEVYRDLVRRALAEDIGAGDITTAATVGTGQRARAVVLAKCRCVVAGLDVAFETFRQLDPEVRDRDLSRLMAPRVSLATKSP